MAKKKVSEDTLQKIINNSSRAAKPSKKESLSFFTAAAEENKDFVDSSQLYDLVSTLAKNGIEEGYLLDFQTVQALTRISDALEDISETLSAVSSKLESIKDNSHDTADHLKSMTTNGLPIKNQSSSLNVHVS